MDPDGQGEGVDGGEQHRSPTGDDHIHGGSAGFLIVECEVLDAPDDVLGLDGLDVGCSDFAGEDGVEKTLYYFSTDLSNSGVNASGFLKFCASLAPGNSLLKSASYLLHSSGFSTVRTFILANSATIIQDDSGIPLGYYSQKKWRFFPFGHYAGPIAKFPGKYQKRYEEMFRGAQPIDFGIGYRWRTYETNLLLSVRLNPDEPLTAADTTSSVEPPAEKPQRPRGPRPPGLVGPQRGAGFFWFPWGR